MKILLIHNHYASIGGESRVFDLEKQALEKNIGKSNVLIYEAFFPRFPVSLIFSIFFSFRHYLHVFRLVKKESIDIVHVHNFFPIFSSSIFFAAKHAGAKTIQSLHNYRWWCINGNFFRGDARCTLCTDKNSMKYGIQYGCYRNSKLQSLLAVWAFVFYKRIGTFGQIDRFIAMSEFQKEKLQRLGVESSKIILKPNMVPALSNFNSSRKGYVYVGRLEEAKGVKLLLKVWQKLPSHFELTLVGGGPLEDLLRSENKSSNIKFKGYCSPKETLEIMSTAKYGVHTSLMFETFGLTIVEFMRLGVPVIAFDIGTRKELIANQVNGFLCKPEDLESTIMKADLFEAYDQMSNNSTEFAKRFDEKTIIEEQLSFYQQMILG